MVAKYASRILPLRFRMGQHKHVSLWNPMTITHCIAMAESPSCLMQCIWFLLSFGSAFPQGLGGMIAICLYINCTVSFWKLSWLPLLSSSSIDEDGNGWATLFRGLSPKRFGRPYYAYFRYWGWGAPWTTAPSSHCFALLHSSAPCNWCGLKSNFMTT